MNVESLRRAQLQERMLLRLMVQPVPTLTALAREVEVKRESVSRAIKALNAAELVVKEKGGWTVTDKGRKVADALKVDVAEQVDRLAQSTARLIDQQAKLVRAADMVPTLSPAVLDSARKAAELVSTISASPAFQEAYKLSAQSPFASLAESIGKIPAWPPPIDSTFLGSHLDEFRTGTMQRLVDQLGLFPDRMMFADILADQQGLLAGVQSMIDTQLQQSLSKIDVGSIFSVDWPWMEDIGQRARVRAAFTAAGLVPAPSMDQAIIDQVVDAHERGATPDELGDLVLEAYDSDDCARLALVVDRLATNLDFRDRGDVLRDTLTAHRQGLDTITTYPLVAMIEGVLIPFIADVAGGSWVKHNQIAGQLDELPAYLASMVGFEAYGCLVQFLRDKFYEGTDFKTEDPATRSNFVVVNRHRLLHGMAPKGTRINTLRCFLMLDVMGALLAAIRDEIESVSEE